MCSATPYILHDSHTAVMTFLKEARNLKHFHRILCTLTVLVALALLLTGCFSEVSSPVTDSSAGGTLPDTTDSQTVSAPQSVEVTTYPAPRIFSRSVQPGLSPRPAEGGGYYYIRNASDLLYYISEDGTQTVLCGQGGCTHSDDTCPAYYAHLSRFAEHNGRWYVVTEESVLGGSIELFSVNPADGKRTSLYRWKADENSIISMDSFICTDKAVTCIIGHTDLEGEINSETLECILVEDGTQKTLRSSADNESFRQMGAVSAGLVLETSVLEEKPMDFDAYQKLHPNATGDEYSDYYFDTEKENTKRRLELVDLDGTVLDTIASSEDGYVSPVDAYICWNEMVVYQSGDKLYCYDSTARKAEPQAAIEGSRGTYRIYDGRISWSYLQETGPQRRFIFRDINTGEVVEWERDQGIPGIYAETDDTFVAVAENGIVSISKQDFYREDFDSAELLIKFG